MSLSARVTAFSTARDAVPTAAAINAASLVPTPARTDCSADAACQFELRAKVVMAISMDCDVRMAETVWLLQSTPTTEALLRETGIALVVEETSHWARCGCEPTVQAVRSKYLAQLDLFK